MSDVLSIHIPITLRQRGGRKEVVLPHGSNSETIRPQFKNALIKALDEADIGPRESVAAFG